MKRIFFLNLILAIFFGFSQPATADVMFGWTNLNHGENSPAAFMFQIHELSAYDFDSASAWPEFLWEISSVSYAYRSDPLEVYTVLGNPFEGWEGVRCGAYIVESSPFWHLELARDLRVEPLSFQFGNIRIWSDPSFYPFRDAVHELWSLAYVDDPSQVWTGIFETCDSQAQGLDFARAVPEPSTMLLLITGIAGLAITRLRRKT